VTVAVTDQQVATLRAYLSGDATEHKRLLQQFDRDVDSAGYSALVTAAFFAAVDRRFGKDAARADVIEYVADVRSRLDEVADAVDPRAAERLIWEVLGEGSTGDLRGKSSARAKLFLTAALVADANFGSSELDEFVAKVRKYADHLLG
jgi:hypothetical protein